MEPPAERRTNAEPEPAPTLTARRFADHRAMPWRNGGGITRQVALGPAGADERTFDWRVSIAEVASSGPFSAYPGIDRIIMLVAGRVMVLTVDGDEHALDPLTPFCFAGEAAVTSRVPEPTRDLNVMTRRGRASGTLEVIRPGDARSVAGGDPLIVVALSGEVRVTAPGGARVDLGTLDAALWPDPRPLTLDGADAAAIRIRTAVSDGGGRTSA